MTWPTLSVIIPSLNQGCYIERNLLSILRQDYPGRVQIIVSDGGSTDMTVDVLRRYPQVTWWSEKDRGIADATNKGIAVATGEILAIQSSDDFYLRDAFRISIEPFRHDPDLAISTGCDVYLQPHGKTFACSQLDCHRITPRSLLMGRMISQHCAFFRRDVLARVHELRTSIHEAAEVDFWYRILHFYRGQFIPFHTAAYQLHSQQLTRTGNRWYENLVRMVETCEADPEFRRQFKLTTSDKRDLYARWEILQEQRAGNIASVIELIDRLIESPECTQETIQFLAMHALIPRTGEAFAGKHQPNHHLPDLGWYENDRAVLAVA